MSTRSEYTVTINKPIAQVHKAYTTREYWDYLVARLTSEPGTVHEFSESEVVLHEVLPTTMLPDAMRTMITQALKLVRVVTIGELEGDSVAMHYDVDVTGTPVNFGGDFTLTGEGDVTKVHYLTDVNVNIPVMGAIIEPKVGESLNDSAKDEARLTEQWISDNL